MLMPALSRAKEKQAHPMRNNQRQNRSRLDQYVQDNIGCVSLIAAGEARVANAAPPNPTSAWLVGPFAMYD
jgi:hypothetical protein